MAMRFSQAQRAENPDLVAAEMQDAALKQQAANAKQLRNQGMLSGGASVGKGAYDMGYLGGAPEVARLEAANKLAAMKGGADAAGAAGTAAGTAGTGAGLGAGAGTAAGAGGAGAAGAGAAGAGAAGAGTAGAGAGSAMTGALASMGPVGWAGLAALAGMALTQ